MFYPCAVMTVAVGFLRFLMIWVVAKFKDIFKDMLPGQSLPGFTRFVLGVSDAIAHHFLVTAACVIVAVIGLVFFVRTRFGRRLFDKFKLNMPVLGR